MVDMLRGSLDNCIQCWNLMRKTLQMKGGVKDAILFYCFAAQSVKATNVTVDVMFHATQLFLNREFIAGITIINP